MMMNTMENCFSGECYSRLLAMLCCVAYPLCATYAGTSETPVPFPGYSGSATVSVDTRGAVVVRHENPKDVPFAFFADGELVLSSEESVEFAWQPLTEGEHELSISEGEEKWTTTLNVSKLSFATPPVPNPPEGYFYCSSWEDGHVIGITPEDAVFGKDGGYGAFYATPHPLYGAPEWMASVSDRWIELNSTEGRTDNPIAYKVSVSTNVGQRIGYIYVNGIQLDYSNHTTKHPVPKGYIFTVTQGGYSATVSPMDIECECDGKVGTVSIGVSGPYAWDAKPNDNWISITPTHGVGSGTVSYSIAPYNEVSTRSGSFTVGDKTVSVFQYGRRMKLSTYNETRDYLTHVIPITVNALAVTTWKVTPNASWISVVDGGNGHGGDSVTIAIAENPSYKARTGTVTIGSETFTVTQEGRTDLLLAISPERSEASVNGANGLISVLATPDLPWSARSSESWLTIMDKYSSGTGNGNVVYVISPNPTLNQRTGKIIISSSAYGVSSKTHTVVQDAAVATVSSSGYEFVAAGETTSVNVMVSDIVQWTVEESLDWITVQGSASRTGPGTVVISAKENTTIYPRSGTITIAGHAFAVSQKARGVEVEYDNILFATGGGGSSFSVHPDGTAAWTAVASDPTWIVIWKNDSGVGDAEVEYIIAPYVGVGTARMGTITVGDKVIYVTQRAYDLDIDPKGMWVNGNAGAGEIGVSASIGDVWEAIVTEPWITVVSGYDSGTGSGTVRFTYTENNTGKTRSGKIIVSGEAYTLEQAARIQVDISASVVGGGKVSGAGAYTLGEEVKLTAVANDGYEFLYWTGTAGETMRNPLTLTADVAKSVTAHFAPKKPVFTACESSVDGVRLTWQNLAWATEYRIYRAPSSTIPTSALATLVADGTCTYLDSTGDVGKNYWYWIEAIGAVDDTECDEPVTGARQKAIVISPITYANLHGSTHSNPDSYQEGMSVGFTPPSGRTGYTFTGWSPVAITADMTGAQTVTAGWRANTYQIAYYANGGSGTMAATDCEYDKEGEIAANGFTRSGYVFKGWATEEDGEVVYQPGAKVTNLTSKSGGVVTLYAVWELDIVETPVIVPGDGSVFRTTSCMVSISCATEGAQIYYTTNGRTPREDERCLYTGEFEIEDTTTVIAFAVLDGKSSEFAEALIAKGSSDPLTLENVLDAGNLTAVSTGGDADWCPVEDVTSKIGGSCAVSGVLDESDGELRESWLEVKVSGKGTLTFWWRISCDPDPRGKYTYDYASCEMDGELVARTDGENDWMQISKTFDAGGDHVIRWTYLTDGWESEGYDGCVWVDGVAWTPLTVVEPIPELPSSASADEVRVALEGSADAKLQANITDATVYGQYREWAMKIGAESVKGAANSWISFAVDSAALLEKVPVDGDLKIEEFKPAAAEGAFDFTVSVKDVAVGSGATDANLKKVFGLAGTTQLGTEEFDPDKVALEFGTPVNGKLKFTASPKDKTAKSFFMKMKVK